MTQIRKAETAQFGSETDNTTIEADGTIKRNGAATAWDDVVGNLAGKRLFSTSGSVDYNYSENSITFSDGGDITNDGDVINGNIQYPHKAKVGVGAELRPHLHWWQNTGNGIVFTVQYRIQNNGQLKEEAWTTATATSGTDDVFTYPGTGTINQITEFPAIDMSGANISSTVQFRLTRSDSLGGTVDAYFFDAHYETTTDGSREEYVK